MKKRNRLAIIGTSLGQRALYEKARELGIDVFSFSWEKGQIPNDLLGVYSPISALDVDAIEKICKENDIEGVVSNASSRLSLVVAELSERLKFHGNSKSALMAMQDKSLVREKTAGIPGLKRITWLQYEKGMLCPFFPCIVKPISGGGKKGVGFAANENELATALSYTCAQSKQILVEEYVVGREVSVESISYEGSHYVVQITDKVSTGAPHFVEIAHHQPSSLEQNIKEEIKRLIPDILTKIGFENGASHTELKVTANNEIALIEVNPRGGGDEISSTLINLSTDYDYVKAMIDVALGVFKAPVNIHDISYSGICYLCEQTRNMLDFFNQAKKFDWYVKGSETPVSEGSITEATGNQDRNGYFVYNCSTSIRDILGVWNNSNL